MLSISQCSGIYKHPPKGFGRKSYWHISHKMHCGGLRVAVNDWMRQQWPWHLKVWEHKALTLTQHERQTRQCEGSYGNVLHCYKWVGVLIKKKGAQENWELNVCWQNVKSASLNYRSGDRHVLFSWALSLHVNKQISSNSLSSMAVERYLCVCVCWGLLYIIMSLYPAFRSNAKLKL